MANYNPRDFSLPVGKMVAAYAINKVYRALRKPLYYPYGGAATVVPVAYGAYKAGQYSKRLFGGGDQALPHSNFRVRRKLLYKRGKKYKKRYNKFSKY